MPKSRFHNPYYPDDILFETDDETCILVSYRISGGDPGNTYGLPENCWPAEDPEVELGDAWVEPAFTRDDLGLEYRIRAAPLSAGEEERLVEQILENYDPGDAAADYADYLYDQHRDREFN